MIREIIFEHMQADVTAQEAKPEVPLEVMSNYYAGSMLATLEWWIDNDMPYSTVEMVQMM